MAKRKIERLTASQQKTLVAWRQEWQRVGTCTEPADRPRAEAAIIKMYRAIRMPAPRFVWCDSPMTSNLAMHVLAAGIGEKVSPLGAPIGISLKQSMVNGIWDSLDKTFQLSLEQMWNSLNITFQESLKDTLWEALRHNLSNAFLHPLGDQLWDALSDSHWSLFSETISGSLLDSLQDSLISLDTVNVLVSGALYASFRDSEVLPRSSVWSGQLDAYWVAVYAFTRDVLRGKCEPIPSKQLGWNMDICRSCMWWWPYDGLCVVSERPRVFSFDDQGRLHAGDGPAIGFRDGWGVWSWHGVRVPQEVIEQPEMQYLGTIRAEPNAEVKRIRIERYGWNRYLSAVRAVVIDQRENDIEATREVLMRTREGETVLVCACPSTGRVYHLEVPSEISTCQEAQLHRSGGLSNRTILRT